MEEIVPGALYLVSTPIGNLQDITFRAIYILKSVTLVAAEDTRVSRKLFDKYDIRNKLISFHSHNQKLQAPYVISRLKSGDSVALISDAGTPGISDPAYWLVSCCKEESIRIIPIPGASALLPALITSGLPTNKFVFEGFLPLKKGRKTRIKEMEAEKRTIVIYESPHRIIKTIKELSENWGDRKCSISRELTKKFEEILSGTFSEMLSHFEKKSPRGEFVIIVDGKKPD